MLVTHDRAQAERLTHADDADREGGSRRDVRKRRHISLGQVAGSLALVAVAIAASFWRRAELEQDIAVAVVARSSS